MENKYDDKKIGMRIKQARKETRNEKGKRLSLDDVGEICRSSRQLVSKWEHGDLSGLSLNDLTAMSNLFQCDVGFLLCEHETKRRVTVDIQKETGLSVKAIEKILHMSSFSTVPVEVLSSILSQPDIEEFLHKICELAQTRNAQIRLSAREGSSKNHGEFGESVTANIAKQDIEEIGDSKELRISKLFNRILDGVVKDLIRENSYVCKRGSEIAERALDTELNKMIRASYFKEDEQNG